MTSAAEPTGVITYATPGDLRRVRALVRDCATALGLPATRVELLALAVTELATNTLQHTTGGGRISLWRDGGRLFCDVVDAGPVRVFGRRMPAADAVSGRGLAIVERVCDEVTTSTGPDGTLVRLRMDL